MPEQKSYCKYLFQAENRLDVQYNDVKYDVLFDGFQKSKFEFIPLSEAVTFSNESRNPLEKPDEEFIYIDIGNVDTKFGLAFGYSMMGKDATSSRVRRVVHKEEILVSTTRPTRGAICIVPISLDNQICSTGFAVLRPKKSFNYQYLFYILRSKICLLQFEKLCSGSGYPAINIENDLLKVLIPKMSLPEQEAMVDILDNYWKDAYNIKESLQPQVREIENKFMKLLGFNFPFRDQYYYERGSLKTSCFIIPVNKIEDRLNFLSYFKRKYNVDDLSKRYKTVPLSTICETVITRGIQPVYDETGAHIVIKTIDISNGKISMEDCLRVDDDLFNEHNDLHVKKGDILISSTGIGSLGKVAIYASDDPAIIDGHISRIRLMEGYNPEYVAMFLDSYLGQIQMESLFSGSSGQIEIQPADLEKILIPDNSKQGVPHDKQIDLGVLFSRRIELVENSKANIDKALAKLDDYIDSVVLTADA